MTTSPALSPQYTHSKVADTQALKFDPNAHRYSLHGNWIPGVTSVIEPLDDTFRFVPRDIKEAAMRRGTLVHFLTELSDTGQLNSEHLVLADESGLLGYLDAWETFKRNVQILDTEQKVYHSKYRYAGTLDRTALVTGVPDVSLLEIKTGQIIPSYRLQTAAYQAAYNDGQMHLNTMVQNRFVVVLKPDGTYVVEQHKDRSDIDYFISALKVLEWKARHP